MRTSPSDYACDHMINACPKQLPQVSIMQRRECMFRTGSLAMLPVRKHELLGRSGKDDPACALHRLLRA